MQGPERYLRELGIEVPCVVDPAKAARLEAGSEEWINYEVYYFSSDAAHTKFLLQPHAYTGAVTDPVTLERFQPGESSPRRRYQGRLYYFASEESARRFDEEPAQHASPRTAMREMKPLGS